MPDALRPTRIRRSEDIQPPRRAAWRYHLPATRGSQGGETGFGGAKYHQPFSNTSNSNEVESAREAEAFRVANGTDMLSITSKYPGV